MRLVGGVSVAGFRPGLGRGGTTHSLFVKPLVTGDRGSIGEIGLLSGARGASARGEAEAVDGGVADPGMLTMGSIPPKVLQ